MAATTIDHVPEVAKSEATLDALRFLADGNRLRILQLLLQRESCVCEVIAELGQAQPLVSYHLRRLREAGLVRSRRHAQWVYYSIDAEAWEQFTRPIRSFCDAGQLPLAAAFGASNACGDPAGVTLPGASALDSDHWPV